MYVCAVLRHRMEHRSTQDERCTLKSACEDQI